MSKTIGCFAVILVIVASSAAFANAPQDRHHAGDGGLGSALSIGFGPGAPIPMGYYQLCKKKNAICNVSSGQDARTANGAVVLNAELAGQLMSVNAQVNRSIRPVTDMQQYGVADVWNVSPRRGDCEDFALTKKARLLAKGWPSSALLIALAKTSRGEEHAVLIVRTDRGDFVLDNLNARIRGWTPTLYRWKSVQSPTNEWVWNVIRQGTTVQVASRETPDVVPQPSPAAEPRPAERVVSASSLLWLKEIGLTSMTFAARDETPFTLAVVTGGIQGTTPSHPLGVVSAAGSATATASSMNWPSIPPAILMAMAMETAKTLAPSRSVPLAVSWHFWLVDWKSSPE